MSEFSDYRPGGQRRLIGLLVVIVLHLLLLWALVSGLVRQVVEVVNKPIQMQILAELPPPPPPPPPPPKVEKLRDPPKPQAPPPPAFVPPPEVPPVQAPPAPVIQATRPEPPPQPVLEIRPPPPPAPPAPPQRAEVGLACPGYARVLQSSLASAYERVGIEGTVKVLIRVRGSQIVEVTPLSGPREYYRLVQSAVRRMSCTASGADELLVPLDVVFKEE